MKQEASMPIADSKNESVIGAEIKIVGNIEATVDLRIEGIIEGNVTCKTLTVGEHGSIKGDVSADRARVMGLLDGSIDTQDLAVESGGKVFGEVSYIRLKVGTGGVIEGMLKSKTNAEKKLKLVEAAKAEVQHIIIG